MGSLPPIHDLAKQAGVELPSFLGKVEDVPEEVAAVESEAAEVAGTAPSGAAGAGEV